MSASPKGTPISLLRDADHPVLSPIRVAFIFMNFPTVNQEPFYRRIIALVSHGVSPSIFYYNNAVSEPVGKRRFGELSREFAGHRISLNRMRMKRGRIEALIGLAVATLIQGNLSIAFRYLSAARRKRVSFKKSLGWLAATYPILYRDPDIIQIENAMLARGLLNPLEATKTPVIVSLIGGDIDFKPVANPKWQEFYRKSSDYENLYFHCVSDHIRDGALGFGIHPDRSRVIRRSSYLNPVKNGAKLAKTGTKPRRELIVLSRLSEEKGIDLLLEAMNLLIHDGKDCNLHIFGDGPGRTQLEKNAIELGLTGRVTFHGLKPHNETIEFLMNHADDGILVQPSRRDGMPKSVIEGMSLGLPIVAARIGGIPELIEDGVTGLLHEPNSVDSLKGKLSSILGDPALASSLGEKARARAIQDFTLEREVMEFCKFYAWVLSNRAWSGDGV